MMASFFQMNTASTLGSGPLPSSTIANPKGELKAITTRSGIVLDGPSVLMPHPFINPAEDECVKETLTGPKLDEFTIKVPPPLIQKSKPPSQRNFVVHQRDPLHPNIPYLSRMHKQKQQEKDEKLAEKLRDPGKFLISCGFSELKSKALADLADFVIVDYESNPRVPLVLGTPFLQTARALIDVHGEEMILRDGDEILTLNMRHDTSSYSNQHQKES
nr:reverse transcriptase domain-containing protein [Tanacetum cinerariifolium]